MGMGTHWFWWSSTSPGGHLQPGTHVLRPESPSASSLQLWLSEQELPQERPHSWYTWPPEHWTAGWEGRVGQEVTLKLKLREALRWKWSARWFNIKGIKKKLFHTNVIMHLRYKKEKPYGNRSCCATGPKHLPERSGGRKRWEHCSDTPSWCCKRKALKDRGGSRVPSQPHHGTPAKITKNATRVRQVVGTVSESPCDYLKDGTVDDGAERLCVLLPLGVGGAGVRWSCLGQRTLTPWELLSKGRHAALHVSFRCDEVVMLVPG